MLDWLQELGLLEQYMRLPTAARRHIFAKYTWERKLPTELVIDQKAKDTSRYVAMLVCEGVSHV